MARYHVTYDRLHGATVVLDDGACVDDECLYEHAFVYRNHNRGALLDVEHDDTGVVDHWRAFHIDDRDPHHKHLVGDVGADDGCGCSAPYPDPQPAEHGD